MTQDHDPLELPKIFLTGNGDKLVPTDYDSKWMNPAVQAAHMLIGFDPFMLTEVGPEGVSCCCFYHTVVFTAPAILVFTRDEGGMCPAIQEFLDKTIKWPEGTSLEQLRAKTLEHMELHL